MKILFVATVRSHIGQFHMPLIKQLVSAGHQVDVACKDNSKDKPGLDLSAVNTIYEIPFAREPFKFSNLKAIFELRRLIESNHYDIVHCHTPMGAAVSRLAAIKARKTGTKVLYTAHGFHFYSGAPLKNWLLFYPVEKILAHFTDCLILINREDYELAIKKHFRAENIRIINGVGIELSRFDRSFTEQKDQLRAEYEIDKDAFVLIYPADLSYRKNQQMLFHVIKRVLDRIPQVLLLLPGQPILLSDYKKMCEELEISGHVKFLGYRRDISNLIELSDIAVSSSRQEGLPMNIVEAMAMGKPVVATDVRGNADLVCHEKGGFLVKLNDDESMGRFILQLYSNKEERSRMGAFNAQRAQEYSIEKTMTQLKEIYVSYGCVL